MNGHIRALKFLQAFYAFFIQNQCILTKIILLNYFFMIICRINIGAYRTLVFDNSYPLG